jgi:protein TonB
MVRAPALVPSVEVHRQESAAQPPALLPDAPRAEPPQVGGTAVTPRVASVADTMDDRARVSAATPRADLPPVGSSAAVPARLAAPDQPVAGAALERAAAANPPSGAPVQTPEPEDVTFYRMRLSNLAGRFKEYPPLARERGLQGVVGVRVRIGPGLAQPEVALGKSSGIAILDDAAVAMIAKASRTVDMPTRLRGRTADIDVPVDYRLD